MKRNLTIVVMLLMILSGCSNTIEPQRKVIRIGFFPNITHAQALIMKNKSMIENEFPDYEVVWQQFNAGPEELEAFYANEIDLGFIGPVPAINGYSKTGGEIVILSGVSYGGAILVKNSAADINSITDLAEKKIAVPQFGNTQDLILRTLLKEYGLSDRASGGNVDIMQVSNADIKISLERGDIDAAIVPEPWGSRLVLEIGAEIVLDDKALWKQGEYSTATFVAKTEYINANIEVVKAIMALLSDTTNEMTSNSSAMQVIVNDELAALTGKPLSDEALKSSFEHLSFSLDPFKDSLQTYMEVAKEFGFITDVFNIDDAIYPIE